MSIGKLGALAKIIRNEILIGGKQGLEEFQKLYFSKVKADSNQFDSPQHISKENILVREALTGLVGSDFEEEKFVDDILHSPDFFVPSKKLVIEVNGRSKFYPYTDHKNNFLQFKTKLIVKSGYRVLNLNSWRIDAWSRSEDKQHKLSEVIERSLNPSTEERPSAE